MAYPEMQNVWIGGHTHVRGSLRSLLLTLNFIEELNHYIQKCKRCKHYSFYNNGERKKYKGEEQLGKGRTGKGGKTTVIDILM